MKHAIIFALALFLFPRTVAAQNCYVRLTDASGYTPTTGQLDALEQAAAALCAVFDSAGFGGQFKVYDFGFYLHHETTTGGYPEPFARKVEEVAALSPYYLVFGREVDQDGVNRKFWVDMKIPETGALACIEEDTRNALSNLVLLNTMQIYRANGETYTVFDKAEIAGIKKLEDFVSNAIDCCYQKSNQDDCLPCEQSDLIEAKLMTDGFVPVAIRNIRAKVGTSGTSSVKDYAKLLFTVNDYEIDIAADVSPVVSGLQDSGVNVIVFITSDQQYCEAQLDSIKSEIDTGGYDLVIWHHIQITDTLKKEGVLFTKMFFEQPSGEARSLVVCGPVCWFLKGMGEFAVSVLMQASITWLVEDDLTFEDAFSKVDYFEAAAEGITAILPTKHSKTARAATVAFFVVYKKAASQEDYGYAEMGTDYLTAFMYAAIEEYLLTHGARFGKEKIIKGLLKKANFKYSWVKENVIGFDLSYAKFCKKLGLGLDNKLVPLRSKVGQEYKTITSQRIMKGWNSKKIAILGRSQDTRIEPYKIALQKKLGNDFSVTTITDLPGWNAGGMSEQEMLEINRNWIRSLKEDGYTFYDLGYDPTFKTKGNNSNFYNMEIEEIFDGIEPNWPAINLDIP
jgi:hypothetical protein